MAHARHGGDMAGLSAAAALGGSANLNPLGPPDWLDAAFNEGRRNATAYPDPEYRRLRSAASGVLGVPAESLVFGN